MSIRGHLGQAYLPEDPNYVTALLNATIGPIDGVDCDVFYATDRSPS